MNIDIFELRFPANLEFFQNKEKIAKDLEKLFGYWEVGATTIKLANKKKMYSISLECKRIALSSFMLNEDEVSKIFDKIISSYKKFVEIKNIERIGYKKVSIDRIKMSLKEANKLISDKLYPNKKDVEKILGEISASTFVMDSKKDEFLLHNINLIMETNQARDNMWGLIPKEIRDYSYAIFDKMEENTVYFFSDIDCYKTDQDLKICNKFPSFVETVRLLKKEVKKYLIE